MSGPAESASPEPAAEPAPTGPARAAQAVLLAGGRARRLGGEDKALLRREGRPLLLHWREALRERMLPFVVVGPEHLRQSLGAQDLLTREEPAWGGPAAGVRAGVLALGEERPWTLLLAVDVVDPAPLLDWLVGQLAVVEGGGAADAASPEALVPTDGEGKLQHLSAAVSTAVLHRRVQELSAAETEGRPLRVFLEGLRTVHPALPSGLGEDVDTPADAARHRIRGGRSSCYPPPDMQ